MLEGLDLRTRIVELNKYTKYLKNKLEVNQHTIMKNYKRQVDENIVHSVKHTFMNILNQNLTKQFIGQCLINGKLGVFREQVQCSRMEPSEKKLIMYRIANLELKCREQKLESVLQQKLAKHTDFDIFYQNKIDSCQKQSILLPKRVVPSNIKILIARFEIVQKLDEIYERIIEEDLHPFQEYSVYSITNQQQIKLVLFNIETYEVLYLNLSKINLLTLQKHLSIVKFTTKIHQNQKITYFFSFEDEISLFYWYRYIFETTTTLQNQFKQKLKKWNTTLVQVKDTVNRKQKRQKSETILKNIDSSESLEGGAQKINFQQPLKDKKKLFNKLLVSFNNQNFFQQKNMKISEKYNSIDENVAEQKQKSIHFNYSEIKSPQKLKDINLQKNESGLSSPNKIQGKISAKIQLVKESTVKKQEIFWMEDISNSHHYEILHSDPHNSSQYNKTFTQKSMDKESIRPPNFSLNHSVKHQLRHIRESREAKYSEHSPVNKNSKKIIGNNIKKLEFSQNTTHKQDIQSSSKNSKNSRLKSSDSNQRNSSENKISPRKNQVKKQYQNSEVGSLSPSKKNKSYWKNIAEKQFMQVKREHRRNSVTERSDESQKDNQSTQNKMLKPIYQKSQISRANSKIRKPSIGGKSNRRHPTLPKNSMHNEESFESASDQSEQSSISSSDQEEQHKISLEELKNGIVLWKYAQKGWVPHEKKLFVSRNQMELCYCDIKNNLDEKKLFWRDIEAIQYGQFGKGIIKHKGANVQKNRCLLIRFSADGKQKFWQFMLTGTEPVFNLTEFSRKLSVLWNSKLQIYQEGIF